MVFYRSLACRLCVGRMWMCVSAVLRRSSQFAQRPCREFEQQQQRNCTTFLFFYDKYCINTSSIVMRAYEQRAYIMTTMPPPISAHRCPVYLVSGISSSHSFLVRQRRRLQDEMSILFIDEIYCNLFCEFVNACAIFQPETDFLLQILCRAIDVARWLFQFRTHEYFATAEQMTIMFGLHCAPTAHWNLVREIRQGLEESAIWTILSVPVMCVQLRQPTQSSPESLFPLPSRSRIVILCLVFA